MSGAGPQIGSRHSSIVKYKVIMQGSPYSKRLTPSRSIDDWDPNTKLVIKELDDWAYDAATHKADKTVRI